MRYLLPIDIPATFRRGKSVEQFLGRCPDDADYIRYVELRPSESLIEVWVYDVEDIGTLDEPDLYDLPYLEPDGPDGPVAFFQEPQVAVEYAAAFFRADHLRWTNLGVGESEYIDYLRAGRPATWPVPA